MIKRKYSLKLINEEKYGLYIRGRDAGAYWRKLKQRLTEEGSEVVTFCHGLKIIAPDGNIRETDCVISEVVL